MDAQGVGAGKQFALYADAVKTDKEQSVGSSALVEEGVGVVMASMDK